MSGAVSRRSFATGGLAIAAAGVLPAVAAAQARFVEGTHYVRIEQAVPTPPGKIDVVEFFWYECPHCWAFEPALEAWEKKERPDVALRRVPVYFEEVPFLNQQRLFYALESLEVLPTLHRKVFQTIHADRRRMRTAEDFTAFALANGLDPMRFIAAFNSPAVLAKSREARQLAAAYKIDGVPAMGVAGRWYTTGGLANAGAPATTAATANARMLEVVDALLVRARGRA